MNNKRLRHTIKDFFKHKLSNSFLYELFRKLCHPVFLIRYLMFMLFSDKPKVMNISETLDYIIKNKVSVARYGDGEFKWMMNNNKNSFQDNSPELAQRLRKILISDSEDIIICIPDVFKSVKQYVPYSADSWRFLIGEYGFKWLEFTDKNKVYYDANITRPYVDRVNKNDSLSYFKKLKELWNNKNVILVEGDQTRFGVGNSLLENTKSVQRIICPHNNAFASYSEILKVTRQHSNIDDLILIALGPTATVLAFDLSILGYQAIDIGHADVEYEWFKMHAQTRIPIKGKYVNEIPSGRVISDSHDETYINQIITSIS
ncbi:SP_1767 family glycosyltransferase [Latilactobacillus curvatus]|uniref:SP_1767 family glycosyltransferase n=1 Tax=Latilactobacillus curvatus TaxID=28038 RepID=UPI0020C7A413|nr:SP_1767 family glycosyltransferase [Latilactobacillus curvatus]MCP8848752.1 SP_1767 family glycosyltransferase [Latilactobacillus curvatus]MCP8865428.1 SP_1767 family glycosyltransferase [Latilactobacillus curvatus]MCP8874304.1 SP_1767 family glycosyltransferase [Latilactobacillus curvatus]MCP8876098.1 SP_1767 family glycosyltransferase [Latilactobacillus curvatus]MCP8879692.1 SP_1767 family glycosyltransferase [Latilactobacillus curvatus]